MGLFRSWIGGYSGFSSYGRSPVIVRTNLSCSSWVDALSGDCRSTNCRYITVWLSLNTVSLLDVNCFVPTDFNMFTNIAGFGLIVVFFTDQIKFLVVRPSLNMTESDKIPFYLQLIFSLGCNTNNSSRFPLNQFRYRNWKTRFVAGTYSDAAYMYSRKLTARLAYTYWPFVTTIDFSQFH